MPRPRSVDREGLLDAAEEILAQAGLAGLSFGAVAAAAGVPKPTLQSVFGSREAMVAAALDRWLQREQARFDALLAQAGPEPDRAARTRAHILATAAEPPAAAEKMVALLAALASSGQVDGSGAQAWYARRTDGFAARSEEERRLRLALLAAEGAFYVRYLAGVPMSTALWRSIFDDILALAAPAAAPPAARRPKPPRQGG